jgi:hypothetical protein
VFASRKVRRLEREVAELKDELWWQWIGNHEEHCRREWPHSGTCYFPPPEVVADHQGMAEAARRALM